ncbi:MAG: biotin--[acetyl-CoA-carboxylase] ligase [Actinomycetota bacterium]|nr:biotin--[acetyl-CoA-carboxylase] ligase [Actinomycetota bacterium]
MTARTNAPLAGGPPDGWEARLSGTRFALLEHVEVTGSTNADLMARSGDAADGTVLVTDHQTAGRGRLGRRWDAPPGANLLVSVLVRPDWPPEIHPLVTPALAVAVVDALAEIGVVAAVKWPNDLVVEGGPAAGKLAGILAEYTSGPPEAVVVGLGLNLVWPTFGDDAPPGATSLRSCGHTVDRWDLLAVVLAGFDTQLGNLAAAGGSERLRAAHLARSATVGRLVRADTPTGTVKGTAVDIAADGSLLVRPDGREAVDPVAVVAGDVTHLSLV